MHNHSGAVGRTSPAVPIEPFASALTRWRRVLDQLPVGAMLFTADGVLDRFNPRACELLGGAPLGAAARPAVSEVLRSAHPVHDREEHVIRADGVHLHMVVSAEPLTDEAGALVGVLACLQDVTPLGRERDASQVRRGWARQLFEHSPVPLYGVDAEGRITGFNAAAADFWGRRPRVGHDRWCGSWRLFHPDGRPLPHEDCPMGQAVREDRALTDQEAMLERPDETRAAFLAYPTPLHDHDGAVIGAVNMLVDISDRRGAELRQRVLLNELNHRVKNTLATVQSLAAYSFRGPGDLGAMRRAFESRLLTLSLAHNSLAETHWETADLRRLLEQVLEPYAHACGRARLDGAAVKAPTRAAVVLAMSVNELAANALRHGALSAPGGVVELRWRTQGQGEALTLVLDWRERGGPPVKETPRRGFGVRFLETAVARELEGLVDLAFEPDGVRCRLVAPLRSEMN